MNQALAPIRSFAELPKRNRAFVEQYVLSGDPLQAYLAAGYSDSKHAKNKAMQMRSNLRTYIAEKTRELNESVDMAILGLRVLRELSQGAESEAVRLNAAKELLMRAVPERPLEVHHQHDHTHTLKDMPTDEIQKRINRIREQVMEGITIDQLPELLDGPESNHASAA